MTCIVLPFLQLQQHADQRCACERIHSSKSMFQGAIYLNKSIKYGLGRRFLNILEGIPMVKGGNWEERHTHH